MFDRHLFFFFQAEDGIRDLTVTGVQTCALPISPHPRADQGLRGRSRCPPGDAHAASIQHPGTGPRPRASVTLVFRQAVHGGLVMTVYRRILLVVDLTEGSVAIGRKAQALAAALGAEVELLHVVEFVPVEPMGETLMPSVQIEEELLERARQRLAGLAIELGLRDRKSTRLNSSHSQIS